MRVLPKNSEFYGFAAVKGAEKGLSDEQQEKMMNLSALDRQKINRLEQKIPEGMRGAFKLVFLPNEEENHVTLYGLMTDANAPLREMSEKFKGRAPFMQHTDRHSYILAGKSLELVLNKPEYRVLVPRRASESRPYAQAELRSMYDSPLHPYRDTYPLAEAAELPSLSDEEREAAKKVLGAIRPDLRGLFYAVVTQTEGHDTITAFGIDPQLTLQLINDGLLHGIARDPELSQPIGPSPNPGEEPQEITHPVRRSMVSTSHGMMSSEGIMVRLAKQLTDPSSEKTDYGKPPEPPPLKQR